MGMGFAPTWLRQVSPLLHKTTLTTDSNRFLVSRIGYVALLQSSSAVDLVYCRFLIKFNIGRNQQAVTRNSVTLSSSSLSPFITLRAKLSGAVYCYRSCLWLWCMPLFGKTCATTQKKRKKSCFFGFWKKNVKKRKKTGHLITQPLILNYRPKVSTGKSPTSNMLLRNADTRNYATLKCVW